METQKGTKLVYSHVYERLSDPTLYSLYQIRKFAANSGLLKPGPDDPDDIDTKVLENRFRSALWRTLNPTNKRHLPKPDGSVKNRGKIEPAWLGATVKLCLLDQWPKEKARLEKIQQKYLARKERAKKAAWARHPRALIAVAAFVALACTTPPARDIIGTIITQGVAVARELAYSSPAKTPEALFQQAWVDYRAGDYEAAAQKAYTILGGGKTTNHIEASCWYLLGGVDWETGANEAALANFQKAFGLYEAGSDALNMYKATIAMVRPDLALGDLIGATERLQTALLIHGTIGGDRAPDLGEYHAMATRLAAAQHDYETALEHAKQRHAIYQQKPSQLDRVAASKSELGFWYAANGCASEAQFYTVEAAGIIFKLNDETRHIYNELNWILIHRLQGVRSNPSGVGSIKEWAKAQGDSRVEALLELALTLEPIKEYADDGLCFETADPEWTGKSDRGH